MKFVFLALAIISHFAGSPALACDNQGHCEDSSNRSCERWANPHVIVEEIYQKLISISTWGDDPSPNYFNNRGRGPRDAASSKPDHQKYVTFIFDRLNDPQKFRNFLDRLLDEAGVSAGLPTREKFLEVMRKRLQHQGFKVEIHKFLNNRAFYKLIGEGIVIEETDPVFSQNFHGFDSHLVQMAYIAGEMETEYGPGQALAFYKFMGQHDYWLWASLFDSPSTDHLGNPSIMARAIAPLGLK